MTTEESRREELSPNRYIEKVDVATGRVIDEPIDPEELLVHRHRDLHPVDVHARFMMGRVIRRTGDESLAVEKMKRMRALGWRAAGAVARLFPKRDKWQISRALFGLTERSHGFRYRRPELTRAEVESRTEAIRRRARERLEAGATGSGGGLRVLLTGGTGFVGKEVLCQAAADPSIREMVVLIRPKELRDRHSGELLRVLSPQQRGADLLEKLGLETAPVGGRFRFVAGDIQQPDLGLSADDLADLETTLTHVVHCAASVAFDDPYDASYRANVEGTLNALRLSRRLLSAPGSAFVAHLSVETSYIHGRQKRIAREEEIAFPANFYNNYYELTKAMASLETERFLLEEELPVVQLCPSIIIGESRTGNNRGDTKVVNAPVNLFGRAKQALEDPSGRLAERTMASLLARLACVFPSDPSARLNLIPVDRVGAGILAALHRPDAVGHRIHLANDNLINSVQIRDIVREELGVKVTLAEPTLHRTVGLPLLTGLLRRLRQERIASILERMTSVFGGYSEWGQPVHEVGNDVRHLGLPPERPDAAAAFRMLCRHNRWVQEFGRIRDPDEIAWREQAWGRFIDALEARTGLPAGKVPAEEFRAAIEGDWEPAARR